MSLSVPNLEEKPDQLRITAESIVKSVFDDNDNNDNVYDNNLIFNLLAKAYSRYKYWLNFIKELTVLKQYISKEGNLQKKDFTEIKKDENFIKLLKKERKIKTEFHGNRDFYSLIRGVAIEVSKLSNKSDEKDIIPIINHFIERNFGGITYDINIDFNLEIDGIKENMEILKNKILNEELEKIKNEKSNDDEDAKKNEAKKDKVEIKIKVTSVFLFKKISIFFLQHLKNNY